MTALSTSDRNRLTQIVTAGDNFTYEYDFGDSWTRASHYH
jgi:hypothetical protein